MKQETNPTAKSTGAWQRVKDIGPRKVILANALPHMWQFCNYLHMATPLSYKQGLVYLSENVTSVLNIAQL